MEYEERPKDFFSNRERRAVLHMMKDVYVATIEDVVDPSPDKSDRIEIWTNHGVSRSGVQLTDTEQFVTRHEDGSLKSLRGEHIVIKFLTDELGRRSTNHQIAIAVPRRNVKRLAELLTNCLALSSES